MRHNNYRFSFLWIAKILAYMHSITNSAPDENIPEIEVSVPPFHTALSGDLHVHITSPSIPPLLLQLSRLDGDTIQTLTTFPVLPEASPLASNRTIVKVPCGFFSKSGLYFILLKKQQPLGAAKNATEGDAQSGVITRSLDVRWPMPQVSLTPEHVETYPERPVMAILEFPGIVCSPKTDSPAIGIPEFWLELHYCGTSLLTCGSSYDVNQTNAQVLYSEQIRGFPGRRVITLGCELFGLAGHYVLLLRPTAAKPPFPHTAAYAKADWSKQFVFNVNARSIFPCDHLSGGITVSYHYPSCILESGDRVRVYAKLRANVASLVPPSSLEYIAEQRIVKGQRSLHFDCDLFTELYVEYCFVYVSQAITGAVADVRIDCVPTLPVSESDMGGWSPWSEWTPCSSTCAGGTRSRHRFCDSPPPRYGAKFCEGPMVETEKCDNGVGNGWECGYGNGVSSSDVVGDVPDAEAEVSHFCRCGCVVHLGMSKPKRVLAVSSQTCPGRNFWEIRADKNHYIQFTVEQFRSPCGSQWLKVRDGSSLSSNLLADLSDSSVDTPSVVNSTGPNLLLEYFSDETVSNGQMCESGFLAYAKQLAHINGSIVGPLVAQEISSIIPAAVFKLTAIQAVALLFFAGLVLSTFLLGIQYIVRYRKYHIAQAEDRDSLTNPSVSCTSLPLTARAASSATLLSEVISLTRSKSINMKRNKHIRLRESVEYEPEDVEQKATLANEEDSLSTSSSTTVTYQETALTTTAPRTNKEVEDSLQSTPSSLNDYTESTLQHSSASTSTLDKDMVMEKTKERPARVFSRRLSNASTTTMTKGCYSPALSVVSTAAIRTTNTKERKDKRNLERLLTTSAGSDFSLTGQDADLEMDYYDYNVVNAGAAPGSYLGMDPAFLVWIPPLDETGEILQGLERDSYGMADPGSNTESPEEEVLLPKTKQTTADDNKLTFIQSVKGNSKDSNESVEREDAKKTTLIHLHEFPKVRKSGGSLVERETGGEKETVVEKLIGIDSNKLEGIRFADDEEELDAIHKD